MKYIWQELKKIFLIFIKDPKPLAAGIIAPSLILVAFSLIFGNFTSLPISVINQDKGKQGELLQESILTQVSPLGNIPYFVNIPLNPEQAESALKNNRITGYIRIPEDLSRCIENQQYPGIDFVFSNYNSDFGKNMRLYLNEGIFAYYRDNSDTIDIRVEKIFPTRTQVDWVYVIATGSLLLATIIGGMFFYLYLYFKEVQYNTRLFYRITPLDYSRVHAVRIFVSWIFSLITGGINIALAWVLTGLNLFSHYIFIGLIVSLVSFIYIGLCSIVCLYLKKFFSSALIAMFGCVLIWFLTGGMHTTYLAENKRVIDYLVYLFPNRYALELMRARVFGFTLDSGFINMLILLVMFVCVTSFSFFLLRRKIWRNS